jgi:hypothetical protein
VHSILHFSALYRLGDYGTRQLGFPDILPLFWVVGGEIIPQSEIDRPMP